MTQDPYPRPVVLVHGYNHDPDIYKHSALHAEGAFTLWARQLKSFNKIPFEWYSGRTFKDMFRAWRSGCLTSYAWAYEHLAIAAAMDLAGRKGYQGADVICHSLGSRVVLQALKYHPNMFRRVIMLNGAETVETALPIIKANSQTQFLNINVRADDVLGRLGAWFEPKFGKHHCIGFKGLGFVPSVKNLIQVQLDDPATQDFYKEMYDWHLAGDHPSEISDHHYSYLHGGNWPLYRQFLASGRV